MTEPGIDLAWPSPRTDLDDDGIAELYAVADRQTPWLRVNFVSSVDGAATHNGLSGGLSSDADKRVFDILRTLCDVLLVGAGTVRKEGYGPMRLDAASVERRRARGLPDHPVFAIASGSLALDARSPIFTDAPVRPIVITTERVPSPRRAEFERVADVIVAGSDDIDARAAVDAVVARGLSQIHCEGGPRLFGSLLAADLVDEVCLTIATSLEAGDARRIARGAIPESRPVSLAHTLVAEDTLILRYLRDR